MSQEATYRNNQVAAYNGRDEGGEKQEDGIENIVRGVQRIHDGVLGTLIGAVDICRGYVRSKKIRRADLRVFH